jgi:putative ABC transport system permease protein
MKVFRQIVSVTAMNLRSLPQRFTTSLVIVTGIAGVVAVLVSVLAMSTGMIRTLQHTGRNDRALVLRNGSTSELASALSQDAVRLAMDAPGVRRNADGKPIASAETLRMVAGYKKEDGAEVHVTLRGVGPMIAAVRPELKLIAGRMFNPAVYEIIVGKAAHTQFKGLDVGSKFPARGVIWTVVGIYASGGDSHESELMADAETVNSADHRGGFQNVTALLDSAASFQKFKDSLTSNPTLAVDVSTETDYLRERSKTISKVISVIAYVVGGIMAVGAIFGALNTLYSAVSARVQEIATLRAIGAGRSSSSGAHWRRDRCGPGVAVLRWLCGQHRRRRKRATGIRTQCQLAADGPRHCLGCRNRADRRTVPRCSCRAVTCGNRVAGGVNRRRRLET